jgi:hypothetical protein
MSWLYEDVLLHTWTCEHRASLLRRRDLSVYELIFDFFYTCKSSSCCCCPGHVNAGLSLGGCCHRLARRSESRPNIRDEG